LPRIGITGHANLTTGSVRLVADGIRAALTGYPPSELVGVTCLARGADRLRTEHRRKSSLLERFERAGL
jgi:hypothetical protein